MLCSGRNSPGAQGNGQVIATTTNPVGPAYYNFHVAQLTVGYVPDVFGLNRRQVESAEAQMAAQQLQLEATYITLASNVVAAALQEASIRAQLAAMERIVDINKETLVILRKQFNLGFVSGLEVAARERSHQDSGRGASFCHVGGASEFDSHGNDLEGARADPGL